MQATAECVLTAYIASSDDSEAVTVCVSQLDGHHVSAGLTIKK